MKSRQSDSICLWKGTSLVFINSSLWKSGYSLVWQPEKDNFVVCITKYYSCKGKDNFMVCIIKHDLFEGRVTLQYVL